MTPITSYQISSNFDATSGSDDNDARQRRSARIKHTHAQPVMHHAERKMSEKLLSEAMGKERQKLLPEPSPKSLAQQVANKNKNSALQDSRSQDSAQTQKDTEATQSLIDSDAAFSLSELENDLQVDKKNVRLHNKEQSGELEQLSRQLSDIEMNMQKTHRRIMPEDILKQLNTIYAQLKDQKNILAIADNKKLKEFACSADFIEGYYEASSIPDETKSHIADSLRNIRVALDEALLINGTQTIPAAFSDRAMLESSNTNRSDAITSKELQQRRSAEKTELTDDFSETTNLNGFVSKNEKKWRNSSASLSHSEQTFNKSEKDQDQKRDDTLPLTTLRSV